jgi:two-component system NtrC family sensor kinase
MAGVTRFIDVISALVPGVEDHGDRFLLTTARDLTDREELETQLRQAQKMDAIGQLTGGVAHDFNNLLTIIMGGATLLRRGNAKDPSKLIDNILLAGERGGALTRQLLSLARNRPVNRQVVDLTTHMPRLSGMLRSSIRGDIDLQLCVEPTTGLIEVDISELEIALLNVALNARDAMAAGGVLRVDVRNLDLPHPSLPHSPNGFISISMRDTGTGMPEDVVARAFEPFFTTKKLGSGTGLGLSQVFGFAQGAGGVVSLESEPGQGTKVTIIIPITEKPAISPDDPETGNHAGALDGRVLLVDDNLEVMAVIRTMLVAMGLEVESTDRAATALNQLSTQPGRFNLVLTDIVMPGMNGVDLAREVRASYPALPVILMSGYYDAPMPSEFLALRKPVSYDELYDAIRGSLSPVL